MERLELSFSFDQVRPRGELLVHTPQVVQKYSAGEPSGVIVEGAPYFRPGDLCDTDQEGYQKATLRGICGTEWGLELVGKRYVLLDAGSALEVVGRVKHCQKLSNGEFISPEAIEAALDKADPVMIASFIVHVDEANDRLVALVVPQDLTLSRPESRPRAEAGLLAAFAKLGASAGLATHEIPKAVAILGEAWSAEAGTLTSSNKVDRAGIVGKFAADLHRIGAGMQGGSRKEQSIDAKVCGYLSAQSRQEAVVALGSDADDVTLDVVRIMMMDFTLQLFDFILKYWVLQVGGDSIAAARIAGSFPGRLTIAQVVSLPLSELRRCVHNDTASTSGPALQFWTAEAVWSPPTAIPIVRPPCELKALLITGVTGFIGPHLLDAIALHGR